MSGVTKVYLWLLFLGAKLVVLTDALPSEPYLLYSNITNIGSVDLNNFDKDNVVSGLRSVIALDVDRVGQKIYYGEHSLGQLYRMNMDGTNKELILLGVGRIEGIAIDWVARLIYWTAYTSEKIEAATLDGKHRTILLNTGLEFPRGIAVDPEEGFLFWSDWGRTPAIERSTLAGSDRKALVLNNVDWPNGITIDYTNKLLYWIDAFHDTVTSIDYNGGQRTKIYEDKSLDVSPYHGFDLDFFGDTLYWTDWFQNSILALNYTTPNGTIYRNISIQSTRRTKGVMGVVVVHPSRQPTVINRCGSNNGGCQQLCMLEPKSFKCACGIGSQLAADGKSCKSAFEDEFIIFADASAGKIYQLQTDSDNVEPVSINFSADAKISRPVALEFDPVEDRVYWTDVTLKIISRAFRNGTGYQTLFADKIGVADGLTVDLAGRNLYWTSTSYDTIEVSRLDGSFRRVLVDYNLHQPRDIIVDPVAGYMYWTDWGVPKIERAFMDGSHRSELVNKSIRWPNGLTIDHVNNKLYWADAYEDSIEFYDLVTGKRDVLINEKFIFFGFLFRSTNEVNHPFGLTLLHEHLFWTDWRTNSVFRAEIHSGTNITRLATGLGKPMDIHAYSVKPKQAYRKTYTFSFPKTGSNFTCISSKSCPVIPSPQDCPKGYNSSREDAVCGLTCREIMGYRYRCECRNWKECAVRQTYAMGCARTYYASYRVRECIQAVKPGRCPYKVTKGRRTCANDDGCPGEEKCCNGVCAKPASIATHPCQINNGGCKQLCLAIPGGRRCGCKINFVYNEILNICVKYIAPSTLPPTKPPSKPPTKPPTTPANTDPVFSHCPQNISVSTDPGEATRKVTWTVPKAVDYEGNPATVIVRPAAYVPPVKLIIGIVTIEYTATDDELRTAYCRFSVEVKDKEPPSYGNTCPQDIKNYTDNNDDVYVKWVAPKFTDNSNGPITIKTTGQSGTSTYPVGTTTIIYSATDAAGLTTHCSFDITIINKKSPSYGNTCPQDIKEYTHNSDDVYITWIPPTFTDNSNGSITIKTTGQTASSKYPVGTTTIIYSATDTAGFTTTCSFDITIIKTSEPVFSNCPNNISVPTDPGAATKTVTWTVPTATDFEGNSATVTVTPAGTVPPINISISVRTIEYKAMDVHSRPAYCRFSIEVKDEEPPSYGNTCPQDIKKYTNTNDDVYVTWIPPKSTDNSGEPTTITKTGRTGSSKYPVGTTTISYSATDTAGHTTTCSFNITVINVCFNDICGSEKICVLRNDEAQCVCKDTCTNEKKEVCGSDGKTYTNGCHLKLAACEENKGINNIKSGKCGCPELANDTSSSLTCLNSNSSITCEVTCQGNYKAIFPDFLKLRCDGGRWLRGNSGGKSVPIKDPNYPPKCYSHTSRPVQTLNICPSGTQHKNSDCIQCPPGSSRHPRDTDCKVCDVNHYQDSAGQTSCKQCRGNQTSTTTGAESCFFDSGGSLVRMAYIRQTVIDLRKSISDELTKYCKKAQCTFTDTKTRRKKRANEDIKFNEEHVVILSEETTNILDESIATLFVLDPTSTSLVPDKALSTENLEYLLEMIKDDLPFPVERIDGKASERETKSDDENGKSKGGVIAGVIIAVLVLFGLAVAVFLYTHKRRQKRHVEGDSVPNVQFTNDNNGGGMQIGYPATIPDHAYENPEVTENGVRHGFVNQVYAEVNPPPPYYATTPNGAAFPTSTQPKADLPHIYDTPAGAEALPVKEPLPEDGVVELIPPKQIDLPDEKSSKYDFPVKLFQKRSPENDYCTPVYHAGAGAPHYEQPGGAEASLRLEPPPKYDDAQLQFLRGKATSSILPNVPKKKTAPLDDNANQHGQGSSQSEPATRTAVQDLEDVTKEQSES